MVSGFAIQFNKNSFGLSPVSSITLSGVNPGSSGDTSLSCSVTASHVKPGPLSPTVQMAVQTNLGVIYFECPVSIEALYGEDGRLERAPFLSLWKEYGDTNERTFSLKGLTDDNPDNVVRILEGRNVYFVAKREVGSEVMIYLSAKTANGLVLLFEVVVVPGSRTARYFSLSLFFLRRAAAGRTLSSGSSPCRLCGTTSQRALCARRRCRQA